MTGEGGILALQKLLHGTYDLINVSKMTTTQYYLNLENRKKSEEAKTGR